MADEECLLLSSNPRQWVLPLPAMEGDGRRWKFLCFTFWLEDWLNFI